MTRPQSENRFYDKYNRDDETDLSALHYASRFDAAYAGAMAIPGMARLHHESCATYVARLVSAAGGDPASDPRYVFHMDQAASPG